MRNDELNGKIKHAFNAITPDIKESVIACAISSTGKDGITPMTRNKKSLAKVIAICATVAAVIAIAVFGGVQYTQNFATESIVSLDVNPSIEIAVSRSERVLEVTALNADGKKVIGDMDLEGSDIDVAVNALVGSMLKNGYITEYQNSVLISVEGSNETKNSELKLRLAKQVEEAVGSVDGSVLSQVVPRDDDELEALAKQYGITEGKAKLIRSIIAANNTYTFEQLAVLSINELNLIKGEAPTEGVGAVGKPSEKAYIGKEKAIQLALKAAGVEKANARELECELDYEKGIMVYEIEFKSAGTEYDVDVNAVTGEVVRNVSERDDDYREPTVSTAPPVSTAYIGKDTAIGAALKHAGVYRSNAREISVELDTDEGVACYEVEFKSGGKEYDYEINAETGAIIKAHSEFDD